MKLDGNSADERCNFPCRYMGMQTLLGHRLKSFENAPKMRCVLCKMRI